MALPTRRKLTFVLLAIAIIGPLAIINTAATPLTSALADNPEPLIQATSTSWLAVADRLIQLLALIVAWLVKPDKDS